MANLMPRGIGGAIFWLAAERVLRLGTGAVFTFLMARVLGPESYGTIALVLIVFTMSSQLAGLGIKELCVRELNRCTTADNKNAVLGSALLLVSVAGIVFSIIQVIAFTVMFSDSPEIFFSAIFLSAALILRGSEVVIAWFEATLNFRPVTLIVLATCLIFFLLKCWVLLTKPELKNLILLSALEASSAAMLIYLLIFKGGIGRNLKFDKAVAVKLLTDGLPLFLTTAATLLYMQVDQLMISLLLGQRELGLYSASAKVGELLYFIPVIINQAMRPGMNTLYFNSPEKFEVYFQRLMDCAVQLALPLCILLIASAETLITIIYGKEFSAAADLLRIHGFGLFFIFINNTAWIWYLAKNHQSIAAFRVIIGLCLNVILNFLLIPKYGAIGAAYATVISRGFVGVVSHVLTADSRPLFRKIVLSITFFGFTPKRIWQ